MSPAVQEWCPKLDHGETLPSDPLAPSRLGRTLEWVQGGEGPSQASCPGEQPEEGQGGGPPFQQHLRVSQRSGGGRPQGPPCAPRWDKSCARGEGGGGLPPTATPGLQWGQGVAGDGGSGGQQGRAERGLQAAGVPALGLGCRGCGGTPTPAWPLAGLPHPAAQLRSLC